MSWQFLKVLCRFHGKVFLAISRNQKSPENSTRPLGGVEFSNGSNGDGEIVK